MRLVFFPNLKCNLFKKINVIKTNKFHELLLLNKSHFAKQQPSFSISWVLVHLLKSQKCDKIHQQTTCRTIICEEEIMSKMCCHDFFIGLDNYNLQF